MNEEEAEENEEEDKGGRERRSVFCDFKSLWLASIIPCFYTVFIVLTFLHKHKTPVTFHPWSKSNSVDGSFSQLKHAPLTADHSFSLLLIRHIELKTHLSRVIPFSLIFSKKWRHQNSMVYLREKKLSAITAAATATRAAAKIIMHFKSSVKERTFLTIFLLQ